ncbi:MAG: hypothetical protein JKY59_08655 [Emcibacter sp.]|nr:hypothetical protein [Emcibacter sp.]
MPRNETILSVFVASPSDVSEEREILETIAQELNKIWSHNLNVRLDLIKWETDTVPGFGDYSQDVINDQINDEYDIFIAIFWSKIGTPTKKADSGTIEEFNRAYEKHKKDPNSIDLMVYFKDQAIQPSEMDPNQLKKIQDLKIQLGEKGGLYYVFKSPKDFESSLRNHLSKIVQKWARKLPNNNILKATSKYETGPSIHSHIEEEIIEDEYGLLDYMEIYEEKMHDMTSSFTRMGEATDKIGSQFSQKTKEINSLNDKNNQISLAQTRKIINLASMDMNQYSEILESQINIASTSREEAFNALSKVISLSIELRDFDKEKEFDELEESLKALIDVTGGITGSLSDFRETISNLPRLTAKLNKSKRKNVNALDNVLIEVETTARTVNSVLVIIDEIKNN